MKNFEDFWDYLLECAKHNALWLGNWLEGKRETYERVKPCENCGSRQRRSVVIWNKTKNWALERQSFCGKCDRLLEVVDERDNIRKHLEDLREDRKKQLAAVEILAEEIAETGGKADESED